MPSPSDALPEGTSPDMLKKVNDVREFLGAVLGGILMPAPRAALVSKHFELRLVDVYAHSGVPGRRWTPKMLCDCFVSPWCMDLQWGSRGRLCCMILACATSPRVRVDACR